MTEERAPYIIDQPTPITFAAEADCTCQHLTVSVARIAPPADRQVILVGVGSLMGGPTPHPHITIWADRHGQLAFIPMVPSR